MPPIDKPREKALEILENSEAGVFADVLLDRTRQTFDGRDSAFICELVYGVLRNRERLDWILNQFSAQPVTRTDALTRNILRLGAYQMLFLDRVPTSAAVNTSVELAKRYGKKNGYVNGLLRNLDRKRSAISYPDSGNTEKQLSVLYSHPEWLIKRWITRFGAEKTELLLQKNNLPAPLTIRTNLLKTTRDELKASLVSEGAEVAETNYSPLGLDLVSSPGLHTLTTFQQGWFMVQDQAAQLISMMLDPRPGDAVLDACAAPGGKATHLAEIMQNQGTLIALDNSRDRLQRILENSGRLGTRIITPMLGDASRYRKGTFDKMLVDAPCSGLGVLRRHPDGRWCKKEGLFEEYQTKQKVILKNCADLLKPGGALVYATCSTEPEENESVIEQFLSKSGGNFSLDAPAAHLSETAAKLVDENGFFHSYPLVPEMDGFFGARLIKKA